jgi:hypothetical protein
VASQDDVRRLALALPETSQDPGSFTFRVAGRQFVWVWLERVDPRRGRVPNREVIAVSTANESEKQALLSLDPAVFFTEPHYDGYPAVLVRLPRIADELLAAVITDAWRARAPRRLLRG